MQIFGYLPSAVSPNRIEASFQIGKHTADFALLKDNKVVIVIEAKRIGTDLSRHHQQLNLYFSTTGKADRPKFGVLTNGEQYNFYTAEENIMDTDPCFTFNLSVDIDSKEKTEKLTQILFNINETIAREQKLYTNTRWFIETVFSETNSEDTNKMVNRFVRDGILNIAKDFNRPLHSGVNIGNADSENVKNTKILISQIFTDIINDNVNQRIDSLKQGTHKPEDNKNDDKTEFTEQERQALLTIRAIASEIEGLDIARIAEDDYQGHCNIIMDGQAKNKKISVLYFNNPKKLSISINGQSYSLNSPSDIYKHKEELKEVIKGLA